MFPILPRSLLCNAAANVKICDERIENVYYLTVNIKKHSYIYTHLIAFGNQSWFMINCELTFVWFDLKSTPFARK
jgi:hypothetical protein